MLQIEFLMKMGNHFFDENGYGNKYNISLLPKSIFQYRISKKNRIKIGSEMAKIFSNFNSQKFVLLKLFSLTKNISRLIIVQCYQLRLK